MAKKQDPSPKTPSSDYNMMIEYWKMVTAVLCGVDALRATGGGMYQTTAGPAIPVANLSLLNTRRGRAAQSPFLPQFPEEDNEDYDLRRQYAPLTNIYADISNNLASKPFSKECMLKEGSPADLEKYAENIDGQGHSMHWLAAGVFKAGIDYGIDWIYIDFPKMAPAISLAAEREAKARPYWVRVPATQMLAVYSDFINGQEIITHARIFESLVRRKEFEEEVVERVRVLNREPVVNGDGKITGYGLATYEVWELRTTKDDKNKDQTRWEKVEDGALTIGVIPLVPFPTGRRDGCSWRLRPPLKDIVYLQIEEFQQESNLKTIKELTAFPMLAGNGVSPVDSKGNEVKIVVGPHAVLFAPPQLDGRTSGSWQFIEPNASSLTFLNADLEALRSEMRNLGMQPLATANLTVVTTANVSMRASNAVQAWALQLKNTLEEAWRITCLWLGRDEKPEVTIHVDFGVELEAGSELTALQAARTAHDISQRTFWDELQRRGVLSDNFDPEEEALELAKETAPLIPDEPKIDPRSGKPLQKAPPPRNAHLVMGNGKDASGDEGTAKYQGD